MTNEKDEPKALNGSHLNGATNGKKAPDITDEVVEELGGEEQPDASEPSVLEDRPGLAAPTPEAVAELAASCARFVLAKYKVPLDGTSDTLSILDQYVRDARADLLIQPAGLPLLQATIGAYLGEVVRRAFDASWFAAGDHEAWRLDFHDVYLTFNPIGMAREALTLGGGHDGGETDGWHAHLEMDEAEKGEILARLARLPEVSDDEYYAPSTRFDVVEIAVEALRAKAQADGTADVRFTAEDYRRR
jgi:hypothetical protein